MSRAVLLRALFFYLPLLFSIFHEARSTCACSEDNLNRDITEIEDYLSEVNLQNLPTIKMMIGGFKCPVNALPFGSLKSDWSRLLLLRDAQPEGSILKEKLETLIRILIVAYYQMEERFDAEENNSSIIDRVQSTIVENQFEKDARKLEDDEDSTQTTDKDTAKKEGGSSTIRNNYVTEYSVVEDNGSSLVSVDPRKEEGVFPTTLSSSIVVNNTENSTVNNNFSIEEERTTMFLESDSTDRITNIDLHNYSTEKSREDSTSSPQPEVPEVDATVTTESMNNHQEMDSENETTRGAHNFTNHTTIINSDLNVSMETSLFTENIINVTNTSQLIINDDYHFIENSSSPTDKEEMITNLEPDAINFEDSWSSVKPESSTPLTPSTSGDQTFSSNNSDCYSQFYQTETLSSDIAAITMKIETKNHTQPFFYSTSVNAMRTGTSKMATEPEDITSLTTTVIDEEKNELENNKVDDESLRTFDPTLTDFEDPGNSTPEVATTKSSTSLGFEDPNSGTPEVATTDSNGSNHFQNFGSGAPEVATTDSNSSNNSQNFGSGAPEVGTTDSNSSNNSQNLGSDAPEVANTDSTTSNNFQNLGSGAPEVATTDSNGSNNSQNLGSDAPEVATTDSNSSNNSQNLGSGAPEVATTDSNSSNNFQNLGSGAPEVALQESNAPKSTTILDAQSSTKQMNVYKIESVKDKEADSKESLQNHLERVSDIFHVFKNEPILRDSKNDNRMRKLPVSRKPPAGNKFWKHVSISPRVSSTTFPTFGRGFEEEFPEGPSKSRKRGSLNTNVEKSFRWFYGLGGRNDKQFGNNMYVRPDIYIQCDND